VFSLLAWIHYMELKEESPKNRANKRRNTRIHYMELKVLTPADTHFYEWTESITWSWKCNASRNNILAVPMWNPLHGVERRPRPCTLSDCMLSRPWLRIHYMELKDQPKRGQMHHSSVYRNPLHGVES